MWARWPLLPFWRRSTTRRNLRDLTPIKKVNSRLLAGLRRVILSLLLHVLTTNVAPYPDIGDPPVAAEPSPNGFGEVNTHTNGTEFYGPTATLAFLLELRSRARSFQSQNSEGKNRFTTERPEQRESRKLSIVNFFHGGDDALPGTISGKSIMFFASLMIPCVAQMPTKF
jgi:hypothetical protein